MLKKIYKEVTREWATSVEEALKSFIRLPALSPDFDKRWEENGVLLKALEEARAWVEKQGIKGLRCEIIKRQRIYTVPLCRGRGNFRIKNSSVPYSSTGTWTSSRPTRAGIRIKAPGSPSFKTAVCTDAVRLMTVMPSTPRWLR